MRHRTPSFGIRAPRKAASRADPTRSSWTCIVAFRTHDLVRRGSADQVIYLTILWLEPHTLKLVPTRRCQAALNCTCE